MKSLDRKLATVFKAALKISKADSTGEKVSKGLHEILGRIVSQALVKAIERVVSEISRPSAEQHGPETAEASVLIRCLLDGGLKEASAVIFMAWLDSFSGLRLEQVLPMLEDDVFQNSVYMRALRQSTVIGTFGNRLTVMVVDIGAYTTDLAKLTFDFTAPADGLRAVPQVTRIVVQPSPRRGLSRSLR